MEGIQIYELKRMDLRDATVIDGFPSVGLVSSIVANYLINALGLQQIGIMDSVYFPTVSLVRNGEPMNPVRIYAGQKQEGVDQLVVFISEFQPPPNLVKGIASTVLDWALDQKCDLLVCPEGLIVDSDSTPGEREIEVYGIGSTDSSMELLRKNKVTIFEEGVITGVAGVLCLSALTPRLATIVDTHPRRRPELRGVGTASPPHVVAVGGASSRSTQGTLCSLRYSSTACPRVAKK